MIKFLKTLPLLLVASLSACDIAHQYRQDTLFLFDTVVTVKTTEYHGLMYSVVVQDHTCKILREVDAVSDAYNKRDVACVYDLNNTNEKIEIDAQLYNLLNAALDAKEKLPYFNPFIGSLSNKWKDFLSKEEQLSDSIIEEELLKMNNTSLLLEKTDDNRYYAQRVGDGLIDVGAIAKGFALDVCENYLHENAGPDYEYMIDAGGSSILLGRKKGGSDFIIKIKDLSTPTYLHLKECFVAASGVSEQGVMIDGTMYSHIISPLTGSAINVFDSVIVISELKENYGYFTDALSTSFMMNTLEEVKELEKSTGVKVILIKDDNIAYKSESLELYHG